MEENSDQVYYQNYSFKLFDNIEFIGKGAFSSVVKARHKESGWYYAIKLCDLGAKADPAKCIENLNREIALHKSLNHKNIVKLHGFFIESNHVNIILDYIPNGNLFTFVRHERQTPLSTFLSMFITIANTIRFLHSKNIIHRDIKPENILLDENYNPVFCDFGWSIQLDFNESRDTFCGTLEYIAPEIFKGENYSKPADIWSLGVLLFEMMHGYSPFKGKNYKEVSEKVITGSLQCSDTLSQRLINLIHAILVSDPEQRPTIDSIIEECTSILEGNEIMSMKTRSHINLSIFFDAKNKVERLGTSNHESSKATNITKSTSPSFLKTAFSSFKTGKNGETSKINDFKVAFESQPQPINISTLAHKKQKGTEGSNNNDLPPELKQQFTVLKSNSNFFKTNEYKQENILSASSSEKKFSDRSGSRRMKVRVYLASGTSEEKNMDHHVNSSNQSVTLGRKESGNRGPKNHGDKDAVSKKNSPSSKKDLTMSSLLRRGLASSKGSTENQKKLGSTSKEKRSSSKANQPKAIVNFYTKKGAHKGSPRVEDKFGKLSGKLSESQKLVSSTPKNKQDKEQCIQSMLFQSSRENFDKEKDKATQILTKISKKITNPKSSLDSKKAKAAPPPPVQNIISQRTETPSSFKEVFKAKAKSFRSSNSIHHILPLGMPEGKKKS